MKKIIVALIIQCFSLILFSQIAKEKCKHNHCQTMKNMQRGGGAVTDPGNLRSDTLDILEYQIDLDMTLMNTQQISASCAIHFRSKMNDVDWINLDLLGLTVDSVVSDLGLLAFNHVGELLHVQLPIVLNENDQFEITVFYHGSPENDPQWGGFYFASGYAYNLGVGFMANPHNYGRVWFPCFDNFVERSLFDISVLTNLGRTAYCGGNRISVETVGQDSLRTRWVLSEEIPSYLTSVAVANYTHSESVFESVSGDFIPIYLTSKAVDTTEFNQSFINLVPWLEGAELRYGPYRWPRVGFTAVPFNGGAMEHATNIAYPLFAIDGNLGYETLYAHELAHHWWGDLVTCRNAFDMWINEGWASYSEAVFKEVIYGHQAYIEYVKANHKDVLLYAHQDDGARYPVSPVPHELTYGSHVYNKGADMVHTLRGYMGDDDFFIATQAFLEEYQYSDVSSEELRDFFQTYTSHDITAFFDNWIFAQGFPEFRVKEVAEETGNNWSVTIEQHQYYATDFYQNVPMKLTALNPMGEKISSQILVSNEVSVVNFQLPLDFVPTQFFLNDDDDLSLAVLAEERWINQIGTDNFDYAEMDLDFENLGEADSIFMRIENHFSAVDENQSQMEYFISPDRWWNVITTATVNASINAEIRFYGNEIQANYFDTLFFKYVGENGMNEDSLLLLYRSNGTAQWQQYDNYTLSTQGSNSNWTGRFVINNLKSGQYAWAVHTGFISISENQSEDIQIFSTNDEIVIHTNHLQGEVAVTDATGKSILHERFSDSKIISTNDWSKGVYILNFRVRNGKVYTKNVIVE